MTWPASWTVMETQARRQQKLRLHGRQSKAANERLRLQVQEAESSQRQRGIDSQATKQRFRCLLTELLPSISLERDSFDLLFHDIPLEDLTAPLRHIFALQASQQVQCKRFHPTPWLEINHGKFKPDLRIYFLKHDDKYRVYVSPKKRQDADAKWLKANC